MKPKNAPVWDWSKLGAWLRQQRLAAKLTQEELADKTGVTFQMVQKYEKGICRIPADKLVTWCRACACELSGAIAAAEAV